MANSFGYRWRPPTDRSVFLPRKSSASNDADRAFRRSGILSVSLLNGLNGAQRLNDWNDLN
jgi:hypothetical protein